MDVDKRFRNGVQLYYAFTSTDVFVLSKKYIYMHACMSNLLYIDVALLSLSITEEKNVKQEGPADQKPPGEYGV